MSSFSNTKNRPDEVRFVESEARKIHPAFSGAEYDERSHIFVPRERFLRCEQMKKQMDCDVGDLEQALKEYQSTCSSERDRGISLRTTTWADVFRQMEDAQVATDERYEKGIMRLWRKFGDNVTVKMQDIDPWLNMIPTEYGLCVVRAGIVLVLRAASRNAEDHKKLQEAMAQIMQTVADARPKSNIFGQNSDLDAAVRGLYVSVLGAVSVVIHYLRDRNAKSRRARMGDKIFSSLKQSDNKPPSIQGVEQAVEKVRGRANEFQRQYGILKDQLQRESYELQFDSYEHIRQVEAQVQSSNKQLSDFEGRLERIETYERELLEENRRRNDLLEQICKREAQASNALLRFLEQGQGATKNLGQVSSSMPSHMKVDTNLVSTPVHTGSKNELLVPGGHVSIRPTTPIPSRPTFLLTVDELRQILGIPLRMANDDLQEVIMSKSWLRDGAAAQTLLTYANFQEWLIGAGSQVLLIEGADADHHHEPSSAMSILTVDIMTSLMKANGQGQVAVIHFFCGLHSHSTEGPKMMARALIFQIMAIQQRYRCLNLDFISSQQLVADLRNHNLGALLFTLQQLCCQLPQYLTVYCFIDGIDSYESCSSFFPFRNDMVAFLSDITRTLLASGTAAPGFVDYYRANGPRFNLKVLFTSPAATLFDKYVTNRIMLSESDVDTGFADEGAIEDIF